jgi:hypothetical protein
MTKNCSVCNQEILTRYTMRDSNDDIYCSMECFRNAHHCHECGKVCKRTSMFSYCSPACEEKHDARDEAFEKQIAEGHKQLHDIGKRIK